MLSPVLSEGRDASRLKPFRRKLDLCGSDQLRQRHVHGPGDPDQRDERRVLFCSFDATHMRPVDLRTVREFLLADTARKPRSPDRTAKRDESWIKGIAR